MITPAFAQAAGASAGGADMIMQLVPFALILVIMYFLMIRPQQRRVKAHQEMVANLRRNDVVVFSGISGKVSKLIDDKFVEVEIADNVKVRVLRGAIGEVTTKQEPVTAA